MFANRRLVTCQAPRFEGVKTMEGFRQKFRVLAVKPTLAPPTEALARSAELNPDCVYVFPLQTPREVLGRDDAQDRGHARVLRRDSETGKWELRWMNPEDPIPEMLCLLLWVSDSTAQPAVPAGYN